MRLKDRPLKLAALIAFGTAACVLGGLDLMDGEIYMRRWGWGDLSAAWTPVRFWAFVCLHFLACCFVAFGWFVLRDEWNVDYRLPPKQALDDPTRRA